MPLWLPQWELLNRQLVVVEGCGGHPGPVEETAGPYKSGHFRRRELGFQVVKRRVVSLPEVPYIRGSTGWGAEGSQGARNLADTCTGYEGATCGTPECPAGSVYPGTESVL